MTALPCTKLPFYAHQHLHKHWTFTCKLSWITVQDGAGINASLYPFCIP